ncbi:phosphoribosyltransferase family protein [Allonocardiopsis opalescens]|uniref:Putative phosphoribosyl transferase n=1 Tax=Allonocardiopsis opalescens TaxID=1144618 RepID=A0A2T0PTY4_9ACTN|nr:phosphoribosyltransferase family protein [Allonocardiopsis opalescens]PRX92362.1 putative phosphoribosyl transferase [Allonocardiopsis opalescens]
MTPSPISLPFTDRADAGRQLAARMGALALSRPLVLALPRGGVPVAAEIARRLDAPLDVWVVRKIGAPGRPELAAGAMAEGAAPLYDPGMLDRLGTTPQALAGTVEAERAELRRRIGAYRGKRPAPDVHGRDVIVVDDGLATGATARAALRAIRAGSPARLILAVPVASADALAALRAEADDTLALTAPASFGSVGEWYRSFTQLTDADVIALLSRVRESVTAERISERAVRLRAGDVDLDGDLVVPWRSRGLVFFSHGQASGRTSPRNRAVAAALQRYGFTTLLCDLLTDAERDPSSGTAGPPAVALRAQRLAAAVRWLRSASDLATQPVGLCGSGSGAAAALTVASRCPDDVAAVVCRGGRPDLAGDDLPGVRAPTLLLVGGADPEVREANAEAAKRLGGPAELVEVPGAGHLFAEPGTLDEAAARTAEWFQRHLG